MSFAAFRTSVGGAAAFVVAVVLSSCSRDPGAIALDDARPTNHPDFASIQFPERHNTFAAGIGDFDGNGFDDVLFTDPRATDPSWTIFYNDGRTLTPKEIEADNLLGRVTTVRTLDLDDDGLIDILAGSASSTVQLIFQRQDGSFDVRDPQSFEDNAGYVSTISFLSDGTIFFGAFEYELHNGEETPLGPTPNFFATLNDATLEFFGPGNGDFLHCWSNSTLASSYVPLSHFVDSSGILGSYSCDSDSCFALTDEGAAGERPELTFVSFEHQWITEEAPMGIDYFLTDGGVLMIMSNLYFSPPLFRFYDFETGEVLPRDDLLLQSYLRDDIGWGVRAADVDRDGWPDLMMTSGPIKYIRPEFQEVREALYPAGFIETPEHRGGVLPLLGVDGGLFSFREANKILLYHECTEGFCLFECPAGERSCTLVASIFDLLRIDLNNDGCTDWIVTPKHYDDGFLYRDIELMSPTYLLVSECEPVDFIGVRLPRDRQHANVIGEVITDREESPYFRYQTPRIFDGASGSSGGDMLWYPQGRVVEVNLIFPDGSMRTLENVSSGYHYIDEFAAVTE